MWRPVGIGGLMSKRKYEISLKKNGKFTYEAKGDGIYAFVRRIKLKGEKKHRYAYVIWYGKARTVRGTKRYLKDVRELINN